MIKVNRLSLQKCCYFDYHYILLYVWPFVTNVTAIKFLTDVTCYLCYPCYNCTKPNSSNNGNKDNRGNKGKWRNSSNNSNKLTAVTLVTDLKPSLTACQIIIWQINMQYTITHQPLKRKYWSLQNTHRTFVISVIFVTIVTAVTFVTMVTYCCNVLYICYNITKTFYVLATLLQ